MGYEVLMDNSRIVMADKNNKEIDFYSNNDSCPTCKQEVASRLSEVTNRVEVISVD